MTLCYVAGALDLFSGNVARPSDRLEMEANWRCKKVMARLDRNRTTSNVVL